MAKDETDRKTRDIPGTACEVDPAISAKAQELRDVRRERMKLTKEEGKLVIEVAALMKAKDLRDYVDRGANDGEGIEAHLIISKERIKVSALTDADEAEIETE